MYALVQKWTRPNTCTHLSKVRSRSAGCKDTQPQTNPKAEQKDTKRQTNDNGQTKNRQRPTGDETNTKHEYTK